MKKKILVKFGTRPEAIKLVPVLRELEKYPNIFDLKICVSAQHRDMLDQILNMFEIKPDYDLNIMRPDQGLHDLTARMMFGLKDVVRECEPDLVVVHGDTTTTFAGALSAFYEKVPVAHVEAGLRTGNIYAPWPEEANRKLTAQVTHLHFAPTQWAKDNLIAESIPEDRIVVTGNTVIDTLFIVRDMINKDQTVKEQYHQNVSKKGYDIGQKPYVLITAHRRENFGDGFEQICKAIKDLAQENPDIDFVYPVHRNPNVRGPVETHLTNIGNIKLIEPLDYGPFVYLMMNSLFILTDSGGIQEEAPSLGKLVLLMRPRTERPEAIEAGVVRLVGADYDKIKQEVNELLHSSIGHADVSPAENPYGDGTAAQTIVKYLAEDFFKLGNLSKAA